jgi:alpha-glucoside transport system substrate-binding protein
MTMLRSRLTRCAAAAALLAGSAACSGTPAYDTVTIMVPWSGTEFSTFYAIVRQFEAQNPSIRVEFQATRAQSEQLDQAVGAGHPPDLAVLPSIGTVNEYIHPANGETGLARLDSIKPSDFVEPFRGLMTLDGGVYVVPVKADVKSLIWYDPARIAPPPTSSAGLSTLSAQHPDPWCLGLSSGATSGWPGADAIADVLLQNYPTSAYTGWLSGATAWSGAELKGAWSTWGAYIQNSNRSAALTEPFGNAASDLTSGSGCSIAHGALTTMGFSSSLVPGKDYDFVSPASPTPLQVSADFLGMFATNNPGAEKLLDYLVRPTTQEAWVRSPGADAFSAEVGVGPTVYRTSVQQRIAALLQPAAHRTLCFSIADAMEPDLAAAFYQAVTNYVSDPQSLDKILAELDKVQKNLAKDASTTDVASRLCS